MIPLAVLFAIVLCVAILIGLCLIAWFLAEIALFVFPRLAGSPLAQPISMQFKQGKPAKPRRRAPAEQIAHRMLTPQVQAAEADKHTLPAVVLCKGPLSDEPVYLVGVTRRRAIWSWKKKNARQFQYDAATLRAWIGHLAKKHGEEEVFVVWAERRTPQ